MTREELEQGLVECELELMDVDHQLRRWKEELDQVRYASHLDKIIEWQFEKPVEQLKKVVPLVIYDNDSTRVKIGVAEVSLVNGDVVGHFNSEFYARFFETMPRGSYSLGFDAAERAVVARPVPVLPSGVVATPLMWARKPVTELTRAMFEGNLGTTIPDPMWNWARNRNNKEDSNAQPENHRRGGKRPYHLPKLRRQREADESGGRS